MKIMCQLSVLVFAALLLGACTHVRSGMPTDSNATGEAWYVKSKGFLGINFKTRVFFCPAPATKGRPNCFEAIVHEVEKEQPPQTGYGQQPPPPGYYPPQGQPGQPGQPPPQQRPGQQGAPPPGYQGAPPPQQGYQSPPPPRYQ